jgi:lysyl-tRNA synthetase class 2
MPDWLPSASWSIIELRAELLRRVREFFAERGFLEVETPLLSSESVIERHIDPLSLTLFNDPCSPDVGPRFWLQTSPEAAMKRLMAAGGEAIYQITRSFRGGERGRLHNPEFTIVEWYCRGDSPDPAMTLLSDLCDALLDRGQAERISYGDAMRQYAGVDSARALVAEMAALAVEQKVSVPASLAADDRDGWLSFLYTLLVEPRLGETHPAIIFDWPTSQAALARIRQDDLAVAERFELYVGGIELANGYHELCDPAELRGRMDSANARRVADGKPALPVPERLLAAMESGMPNCCGVALGLDRVVMLAAGAKNLADVLSFPIGRA